MSVKYFYKLPYEESDKTIKYRRCKGCKVMCHIKCLENSFTCKKCYVLKHAKKRCNKCHLLKSTSNFFRNNNIKGGYNSKCKICQSDVVGTKDKRGYYYKWSSKTSRVEFYKNQRKAQKMNAILVGYDQVIREIYNKCPDTHRVEHICPLNNKEVCGLHVPWNLQYLAK